MVGILFEIRGVPMYRNVTLLSVFLFLSGFSIAEKVSCHGKLALLNGAIDVVLDTEARTILAYTSEGDRWEGAANYFLGGNTQRATYFLSSGFQNGIQLELYRDGNHRVCISPNRCTICSE